MSKLLCIPILALVLSACYNDLGDNVEDMEEVVKPNCEESGGTLLKGTVVGSNGFTTEVGFIMLCFPKELIEMGVIKE